MSSVEPKIVILLGPPGAGKGTQAVLVAKTLGIPHISTGDMMRKAVSENSDLGKKVKSYLDAGNLVPDGLVIDIVKDRVLKDDCVSGFLLDGFPRTLEQGKALERMLQEFNLKTTVVIDIVVPDNLLIERISKRGESSGRSDDNVDTATTRLNVYKDLTAPLTEYYKNLACLKVVDGVGSIEEVNSRIISSIP